MVLVELAQHRHPVVRARDLARQAAQLRGHPLVLGAAPLAQCPRVVAEQFLLPQQAVVALLSDGPAPAGVRQQPLQVIAEIFQGQDRAPGGILNLRAQDGVAHLGRQ